MLSLSLPLLGGAAGAVLQSVADVQTTVGDEIRQSRAGYVHPAPICDSPFNATIHVAMNLTAAGEAFGVYHLDGYLETSSERDAVRWVFELQDNGMYKIYTLHPSGRKIWWSNSYDNQISVTEGDYSAGQYSLAQTATFGSRAQKVVIYQDNKCLVAAPNNQGRIRMLQLSDCSPVVLESGYATIWEQARDSCESAEGRDEAHAANWYDEGNQCTTYRDCSTSCFPFDRCCTKGPYPFDNKCQCVGIFSPGYGSCK